MENRRQVSQARHERKITKINHKSNWETEQAKSGQNSWKDEFVTIYMALPYAILWIGVMTGQEWVVERMERAFEAMEKTPDWFHWTFVSVMLAAVGIRATKEFFGRNKS
jgi:L-lactate permease